MNRFHFRIPARWTRCILVLGASLLFAPNSNASIPFYGGISQSMGGAGRAAVNASEVGLLNPASFAFVRGYNLASTYRDFGTVEGGSTRNVLFHASENQAGAMFPLAVTYLKTRDINAAAYGVREEYHLSSAQMVLKNLAFGIDGARYSFEPENGAKDSEWDVRLGLLYVPHKDWGVGLVFTNLLSTDLPFLKRGVELGLNYLVKDFFRFSLDYTHQIEDNPTDDGAVMLGIEHTFASQIPLRIGFRVDGPSNENYWTLGLGWNGPRLGLGYTYEKSVSEAQEYGHSVDLRIYF